MTSIYVATFYAGQIINPEDFHNQPVFGSELALLEIFSKLPNVTVFITKPQGYVYEKYGITWRSDQDWNKMVTASPPTHIIISRYVATMIEYLMPLESRIYLWLHDVVPHPAYKGINLNNNFINNMSRRLTNIITVGDSQREEIILKNYKFEPSLVKTIKNGITPFFDTISADDYRDIVRSGSKCDAISDNSHLKRKRAPLSFVYSSGPDRGLWNLLAFWPRIVKKYPYATLQIFHDLTQEHFNKIRQMQLERVYPMGKVTQTVLFEKLKLIDYWLYPCGFFETCCTTVIEMQYHGIICISNSLGALKENNNGIIIKTDEQGNLTAKFFEDAFNTIVDLETNPTKKEEIRTNQYLWAREQTWERRANDWKNLLGI